jgi:iron complex outermembrane recepter protein
MSTSACRATTVALFSLLSAAVVPPASAAEAQLEEITVTARKRTENLQDVPLTITAYSAGTIERRNIKNVQDVIKLTPGLNFDKGFAPQDTRISIRGLPVVRGKPPVGILVDGIDISSEAISTAGGSTLVNVKLVDVEQIEVVKGPQSALYGRSAFGGAVAYTSRKPSLEGLEGSASVEGGQYGAYEGRAAVSFPLVNDKLALRINGAYSKLDGFWKNTVTGNTIGGHEFHGVAVALRFVPTEAADFTLRVSYSDEKSESRPSFTANTATGLVAARPLPANAVGLRLGPTNVLMPASWNFPQTGEISISGNSIQLSVDPLTGTDFAGSRLRPTATSLVGTVDLGFATLSSWTGYLTADSFGRADADFFGTAPTATTSPSAGVAEPSRGFFVSDIQVKANQASQEFRLGSDSGRLRWGVGALYWRERYASDNASLSVALTAVPAGFSTSRAYQQLGQPDYSRSRRDTDHTSAYGTLAFDFTDKFEGSVEARYAHEKIDTLLGGALSLILVNGLPTQYRLTVNPAPAAVTYSTNMFTPRTMLKYNFDESTNAYLSYARGKKPGGYLNVGVATPDSKDSRYNPEIIDTVELGVKSTWFDNRLRANGAIFHSVNKDRVNSVLVADPNSPQGSVNKAVNIGEAKIDGLELELSAVLSESFSANLAYTYLDARYTSSDAPQTTANGIAGPGNCTVSTLPTATGTQTVCITNTNGNELDFSNRHTLSASLGFSRPLSGEWTLNSSIDAQYRSRRFIDANNLFALPAYVNVDLSIGAESEKYGVLLYVNNATNNLDAKSAQTGGDNFVPLPPGLAWTAFAPDKRQVGARFNVKF